jgi:uncharacterized protein (TIGR00255 family)
VTLLCYAIGVRSMTGFGRGVSEQARVRATVDIRGVNHRFLDLKLRGGPLAPALEEAVSTRVRAAVERGSVTVSVHLVRTAGAPRINFQAAGAAHVQLSELARTLGMHGPDLALVLAQPGVVALADDDHDAPDACVLAATDAALAQLQTMRAAEGQALARELTARLAELEALHEKITTLARGVPAIVQARLRDRLDKLLGDAPPEQDRAGLRLDRAIDATRLAQEVALLADRADVTEELVRLASHLAQAKTLVTANEASGRRLDFLVQELGRELNTIGSKSALAEITALVVEGKAVLEKVREQVQNVE